MRAALHGSCCAAVGRFNAAESCAITRALEHGTCRHPLVALLTAGMTLDDVVQVDCSWGCGHRLYSDRG